MGPGDVCRLPLAAVRHGRARQTSESGPCGHCRRVLWVPDPWSQYSGKIRFIEKHGVQDEGGRHVVGIVGPFTTMGVRYPGKIRFIEPQGGGGMGTGDVCRVPLAAVRHGRARQTSEL